MCELMIYNEEGRSAFTVSNYRLNVVETFECRLKRKSRRVFRLAHSSESVMRADDDRTREV